MGAEAAFFYLPGLTLVKKYRSSPCLASEYHLNIFPTKDTFGSSFCKATVFSIQAEHEKALS